MKAKATIIIALFTVFMSYSQSHELGIVAGGTNYIGDIGSTTYIAPHDLAIGGVYKLNRSTRHSYRLSYVHHKITGDDKTSESTYRQRRGLVFKNTINELALGLEFSFWEFNLHESGPASTPYIHTGIAVMQYKDIYYNGFGYRELGTSTSVALPISLGYKMRLIDKLILTAEVSAKYTFTDNLDGSNPGNLTGVPILIGNATNNDWYVFTGVMLTYTFGKRPCLCNF